MKFSQPASVMSGKRKKTSLRYVYTYHFTTIFINKLQKNYITSREVKLCFIGMFSIYVFFYLSFLGQEIAAFQECFCLPKNKTWVTLLIFSKPAFDVNSMLSIISSVRFFKMHISSSFGQLVTSTKLIYLYSNQQSVHAAD